MPDLEKVDQCVLLTKVLWFLPAPAKVKVAEGLYDLGVRVHPDLATKQLMVGGPAGMGGHRPQQMVRRADPDFFMSVVRRLAPELADQFEAATTEEQKEALRAEIRAKHPDLIAEGEHRLSVAKPEDFEQ